MKVRPISSTVRPDQFTLAKVEADIRFGTARQFDKATQDELRSLADKVESEN